MTVGPVVRDEETAAFFDGTARGEFLIRRCPQEHASSPHAARCDTCGSTELRWAAASGDATVVSWSVVPPPRGAGGEARPTVLVVAELVEGPWWWSQVVDADLDAEPDALRVGTPLRLAFERHSEEYEAVPVFTLAGA